MLVDVCSVSTVRCCACETNIVRSISAPILPMCVSVWFLCLSFSLCFFCFSVSVAAAAVAVALLIAASVGRPFGRLSVFFSRSLSFCFFIVVPFLSQIVHICGGLRLFMCLCVCVCVLLCSALLPTNVCDVCLWLSRYNAHIYCYYCYYYLPCIVYCIRTENLIRNYSGDVAYEPHVHACVCISARARGCSRLCVLLIFSFSVFVCIFRFFSPLSSMDFIGIGTMLHVSHFKYWYIQIGFFITFFSLLTLPLYTARIYFACKCARPIL